MHTILNLLLLFTITTATLVLGVITNIIHNEWTNKNKKKLIKTLFLAFSICSLITLLTFWLNNLDKKEKAEENDETNVVKQTERRVKNLSVHGIYATLKDIDSISLELKYAFRKPKKYGAFEYDVDTSGSFLIDVEQDSLRVWNIAKNKQEFSYYDLKYKEAVFTAANKIFAFVYDRQTKVYEFVVRGILNFNITFKYSLGSNEVRINKILQKGDSTIVIDDRRNIYVYAAEKNSIIFQSPSADTSNIKPNSRNDDFYAELASILKIPESAFVKTAGINPDYPEFKNRYDKVFLKTYDNNDRKEYVYDFITKEKTEIKVDSTFKYITNPGFSLTFVPRSNLVLFYGSSALSGEIIRRQLINQTSDWSFVKSVYNTARADMARNVVGYLYDLETGKKIYLIIEQALTWPLISFGRNGNFLIIWAQAFDTEDRLYFYDLTKTFK